VLILAQDRVGGSSSENAIGRLFDLRSRLIVKTYVAGEFTVTKNMCARICPDGWFVYAPTGGIPLGISLWRVHSGREETINESEEVGNDVVYCKWITLKDESNISAGAERALVSVTSQRQVKFYVC
jgi:hypothetical protein